MSKRPTYDEAAVRAVLAGDTATLRNLRATADHTLGNACPDCGSRDIEDNGHTGVHLSFLCTACGHQWEPNA